jgi:hypothetical protein
MGIICPCIGLHDQFSHAKKMIEKKVVCNPPKLKNDVTMIINA